MLLGQGVVPDGVARRRPRGGTTLVLGRWGAPRSYTRVLLASDGAGGRHTADARLRRTGFGAAMVF